MNFSRYFRLFLFGVLVAYLPQGFCKEASRVENYPEHRFTQERLVEDLDPKQIVAILKTGAWTTAQQSISSKETNNDKDPEPNLEKLQSGENAAGVEAFSDIVFDKKVKTILDVGGGKYDVCRDYMKKQDKELLVWDPYNRSAEHNLRVKQAVEDQNVDAATSMAVLNVIPEPEARLAHIATLKAALKKNGIAYFKIWPGEGEMQGSYIPMVNAYGFPGFQSNANPDRFLREVQMVFGEANAKISKSIPHLIVAQKKSEGSTLEPEIRRLQALSKQDIWHQVRQSKMDASGFQHR